MIYIDGYGREQVLEEMEDDFILNAMARHLERVANLSGYTELVIPLEARLAIEQKIKEQRGQAELLASELGRRNREGIIIERENPDDQLV